MKTNTVDIEVNGVIYNSLSDFGLAISNTDYIGTPVQDESNLVFVPGSPGPLNFDDVVFGGPCFTHRQILIKFGGLRDPAEWDRTISEIRNLFEGRDVKLRFLTDPEWYWKGRAKIDAFEHKRSLGTFDFVLPYAHSFKYRDRKYEIQSTPSGVDVVLDNTRKRVIPKITTDAEITVTKGTASVSMSAGTWLNTALTLEQGRNELNITGTANVIIEYTEGSL